MNLDSLDYAILDAVQHNNRLTNAQLGQRVHLSESAVRRRLGRLRRSGVIEADVAILSAAERLVTVIVLVWFREETTEVIHAFRRRMAEAREVSQCYSVTGRVDYILVVHAASLEEYDAWGKRVLLDDPAIQRYDSFVAWSRIKFSTALPLPT